MIVKRPHGYTHLQCGPKYLIPFLRHVFFLYIHINVYRMILNITTPAITRDFRVFILLLTMLKFMQDLLEKLE